MYSKWLEVKSDSGGGDARDRSKTSRTWCKRRGIEEQRLYEVTKMRDQFSQIVKVQRQSKNVQQILKNLNLY
jgi:hypothetical protein